jgi:hypothetical protein
MVGLCDYHAICVSPPSINFRIAEPNFMKIGMYEYIIAPSPS